MGRRCIAPPRLSERSFLAPKGWSTTRNNALVIKSGGQFGISSLGIRSLSALGWSPGPQALDMETNNVGVK